MYTVDITFLQHKTDHSSLEVNLLDRYFNLILKYFNLQINSKPI